MIVITGYTFSERFKAEMCSAQPDTQDAARAALKLLQENPHARTLRLHTLKGFKKPSIYKIDVFSNHSWQITFELEGTTAHLKRLGTHKQIDRTPR